MREEKITADRLITFSDAVFPHAVRRSSDIGIDMGQLRPSLHGVAPAFTSMVQYEHLR
jgi:hypothetical protein